MSEELDELARNARARLLRDAAETPYLDAYAFHAGGCDAVPLEQKPARPSGVLYIREDLVPQWQPIETAPADTALFVWARGKFVMTLHEGRWFTVALDPDNEHGLRLVESSRTPTHYLSPAAPPPAQAENETKG